MTPDTRTTENPEPRTEAAAAFLKWLSSITKKSSDYLAGVRLLDAILVEAEAAQGAAPRNPNHIDYWPKFEPGEACPDCKAIMHGHPCVHHEDWCPIIVEGAAPLDPEIRAIIEDSDHVRVIPSVGAAPRAEGLDVAIDIIMSEPAWPRPGAIRRRAVMEKIRARLSERRDKEGTE